MCLVFLSMILLYSIKYSKHLSTDVPINPNRQKTVNFLGNRHRQKKQPIPADKKNKRKFQKRPNIINYIPINNEKCRL